MIVLAIVLEAVFDFLVDWATYTGYRLTIFTVFLLAVVYLISPTRQVQLAAILAVVIASIGTFLSAWAEPKGVLGGFFDYLIVPLWLGSLFIDLKKLSILVVAVLVGLLVFPLATPVVTLNDILVGPFSFILTSSILLLIITRYRNSLEQDRRVELSVKEQRSRREAARADALLRVADRLNAQFDLEAVLTAIAEEVSRALNTGVSVVSLYDPERGHLNTAACVGLSPELIQGLPNFPKTVYDATVKALGGCIFSIRLAVHSKSSFHSPFPKSESALHCFCHDGI